MQPTTARSITLVVYPGFKALEAFGPMSVFDYANVHLRQRGLPDGYAVQIAAAQRGPVPSDTLMQLDASLALADWQAEATPALDTVIVVGSRQIEQTLAQSDELCSGWRAWRRASLGWWRCARAAFFWPRQGC